MSYVAFLTSLPDDILMKKVLQWRHNRTRFSIHSYRHIVNFGSQNRAGKSQKKIIKGLATPTFYYINYFQNNAQLQKKCNLYFCPDSYSFILTTNDLLSESSSTTGKYVNASILLLTMKIKTTRYCVHEQLFDCFALADRFQTGHL